jgi:uncharacterized OB-fold protein
MTTRQAPQPQKPVPVPDAVTAPFWEGTKQGELRVQRCRACNTKFFYPRERCPNCLSDKLEWTKVSGKGRIYSFIVVRQPGNPAFNDDVPYIYALIQLDEGPRMNGNVKGTPVENVEIDMPVEVYFEKMSDDIYLPQWKAEGSADPS